MKKVLMAVILMAVVTTVTALWFSQHLKKGNRKSLKPSADLTKSLKPSIDLTPVLESLEAKKYPAAYECFHEQLKAAWPENAFIADVGRWREEIGDKWSVQKGGFMNQQTPQGPVCSITYRLTEDWQTEYLLDLAAINKGNDVRIIQWTMSSPVDKGDADLDLAKQVAEEFLKLIQNEKHEEALDLLTLQGRNQINADFLRKLSEMIFGTSKKEIKFSEQSTMKITNGIGLYSMRFCREDDPVSFIELLVQKTEDEFRIVNFNLKARVADGQR